MRPSDRPHDGLPPVCRTLLIPLVARAHGGACFPALACHDSNAAALLARLGTDPRLYLADRATVLNILWRTQVLTEAGRAFFAAHPDSVGVNLGCGLSTHFQWLDEGHNRWVDADLPEVIALRQTLLPAQAPRTRQAEIDLTEPGWWQRLDLPSGDGAQPVFVLCEGVLMYLQPQQVHAVLREFGEQAPAGSRLVLDTISPVGVGRARYHPSVGPTGAEFCWGPSSLQELTVPHHRLRRLQTRSVAECYGWVGAATEACWMPWIGTPMYGMVTLGV